MSCFPWMCRYFKFPVIHPTVLQVCGDLKPCWQNKCSSGDSAASNGNVSSAALQVVWYFYILSVQVVCIFGFAREVRSRDSLSEGCEGFVGQVRGERSGQTRLPSTQNPRVLRVRSDAVRSSEGLSRAFRPIRRCVYKVKGRRQLNF